MGREEGEIGACRKPGAVGPYRLLESPGESPLMPSKARKAIAVHSSIKPYFLQQRESIESPASVQETDRGGFEPGRPWQRVMSSEVDEPRGSSDEDLDDEPDDQSNSIGSEKLASLVQKAAQGGQCAQNRKHGPTA